MDDFCNNVLPIQLRKGRFNKARTIFWSVLPLLALQSAFAAPFSSTWNGMTSGDWSLADNWTLGQPGLTADVFDTAVLVSGTPHDSVSHSLTSVLDTIELDGNSNLLLTNTSTGNMTLNGAGILTNTDMNTGSQIINDGTFTMQGAAQIRSIGSQYAPVLFTNNGSLVFQDNSSANDATVINTGTLDISEANSGVTLAGLEGSGSIVVGNKTLTIQATSDHTITGMITGDGALVKNGPATLTLVADSAFSGITTINEGRVSFGDGGISGAVMGNIVDHGELIWNHNDVILPFGFVISGAGTMTKLGTSTLILTGENTVFGPLTIDGGTVQIGDNSTTGSFAGDIVNNAGLVFDRTDDLIYSGTLSGTTGTITKQGAGKLTLTSDSPFLGVTTISEGVVSFGNGGATGAVMGNIIDSAELIWNHNGVTLPFSSAISGAGTMTKLGSSTLILSGENTVSSLTIHGGIVQVGDGETHGSFAGDIVNNASLVFDRNDDSIYPGILSGSGSLIKNGMGTLTVTADSQLSGSVMINTGAISFGDGGTTGSLIGDIIDNHTLIFNHSDITLPFGAVISGAGDVVKMGTSTLVLNGVNTYTGSTTVNNGTLLIGDISHQNAEISGEVMVNAGGILGGFGHIRSNVMNDGVVMAGPYVAVPRETMTHVTQSDEKEILDLINSKTVIGTLDVDGDYTQTANGRYIAAINAAGEADCLQVSGKATLAGTLSVDVSAGSNPAKEYTILTANNGVFGQFANVDSLGMLAQDYLMAKLNYLPNAVVLEEVKRQLGHTHGVVENDGLIIYDHNNMTIHFSDKIKGSGGLIKNGDGTLIIEGQNEYTGTTIVNNGTLLIGSAGNTEASIASDVVLNEGGTLGGYGSVHGAVDNESGTMSPGASIGTTTVASYTQAANATMVVEVNAAGQSDLLDVTPGAAVLNGTLIIDATGGFIPNYQYTFLRAAGGVTGTFSNLTNTTLNQNFIIGTVSYLPNEARISAVLNTAAIRAAALTPNQIAMANYIIQTGGTSTMQDYIFNATSNAQLQTFLDQTSAAVYGAEQMQLGFIGSHFTNQIIDHVDLYPGAVHTASVWLAPYGASAEMTSDTVSGLDTSIGGLAIGFDIPVGSGLIGIAASGTYFDSTSEGNESMNADGELYQIGLYTSYAAQGWIASASIDGGQTVDVNVSRNVVSGGTTSNMSSDGQATVYSGQGRLSYDIPTGMNHVRPFVGVVAQQVTRDAFTEDGQPDLAVNVDSSTYDSLKSQLGMSVEIPLTNVVKILTSTAWQHEFSDTSCDVEGNFVVSSSNPIKVTGISVGRDSALVKAGLVMASNQVIDVSALYEGQFMDGYQENGGKLQLSIHF